MGVASGTVGTKESIVRDYGKQPSFAQIYSVFLFHLYSPETGLNFGTFGHKCPSILRGRALRLPLDSLYRGDTMTFGLFGRWGRFVQRPAKWVGVKSPAVAIVGIPQRSVCRGLHRIAEGEATAVGLKAKSRLPPTGQGCLGQQISAALWGEWRAKLSVTFKVRKPLG